MNKVFLSMFIHQVAKLQFVSFLILTLIITESQAQLKIIKNIEEIGIIGGLSSVALRGGSGINEGKQFQHGYGFGFNFKFDFFKSQKMRIDSRLLLDRKGGAQKVLVSYTDPIDQVDKKGFLEASITLDYVTLPISLEYSFTRTGNMYVLFGLYGSYLNRGQLEINRPYSNQRSVSQINNYDNFDFGISSGFGYKIPLSEKYRIHIELINYLGIHDISNQSASTSTTPVVRTNSFLFSLIFSKKHRKPINL